MPQAKHKPDPKPRRANGRGTIRDHSGGRKRWQVRDARGRTIASGISRNSTEAERAVASVLTKVHEGKLAAGEKITVANYSARWLKRRSALEDNTRRGYAYDFKLITEHIGHMQLRAVKAGHVRDMLTALAEKTGTSGLGRGRTTSSRTLASVLTRTRTLFREAMADGLVGHDPTLGIKRIKATRTEHPGISLDFPEVARLQELGAALHGLGLLRLWPALFTCISIGLRRAEVLALTWGHVDLETRVLKVRQNIISVPGEGAQIKPHPKSDASNRDINMPSSLVRALEAHQEAQKAECRTFKRRWHAAGLPVFATLELTHPHPDNLNRALEDLVRWSDPRAPSKASWKGRARPEDKRREDTLEKRLLGLRIEHRAQLEAIIRSGKPLPKISPHDLRHTCGSLWLRRGRMVEHVSKDLGHADINVTYRVYRHVLESEMRESVVDLFEDDVRESGGE